MRQPTMIPKGELLDLIWSKPVSVLAKEFGVSPNGLSKICDRLDIARPPKGYWRSTIIAARVQKPQNITDPEQIVQIGGRSSPQRRPRLRMSLEDRREHMLQAAKTIILDQGLHKVTLKSIAKHCQMSEAQAHNIFSTREDLLVELAFQEVSMYEALRKKTVQRGGSRIVKIMLSSLSYLRVASNRGAILHHILRDSNILKRVDKRRQLIRSNASQKYIDAVQREGSDRSPEESFALLSIITSMLVRSASLVSEGRISLVEMERIQLPISIDAAIE